MVVTADAGTMWSYVDPGSRHGRTRFNLERSERRSERADESRADYAAIQASTVGWCARAGPARRLLKWVP